MHAFLSLSSLFLALGLMKFNTNLSQVKVFARFCLSKQTLFIQTSVSKPKLLIPLSMTSTVIGEVFVHPFPISMV
jgi:hypothetical protein